jgi:hypothetical protein
LLLLALPAWASAAETVFVVENHSPAIADGELRQPVGIETLAGVIAPVLTEGCALPCQKEELFSTAARGMTSLQLKIYRGRGMQAALAHFLGRFVIRGWRGHSRIAVTFVAVGDRLEIRAKDVDRGRPLKISRAK